MASLDNCIHGIVGPARQITHDLATSAPGSPIKSPPMKSIPCANRRVREAQETDDSS